MFIAPLHFCFLLKFISKDKALFQLHVAENKNVKFGSIEGSIVGTANCLKDGCPLIYDKHPSLQLNSRQEAIIVGMIHSGIAVAMTKIWSIRGQDTIAFSFGFPAISLTPETIAQVESSVYVHQIPITLAPIKA